MPITMQDGQKRGPKISVYEAVILPATIIAAAFLLWKIVYPAFFDKFYLANDLGWFTIPMRHLYADGLRAGRLDIWTPSLFYGFYAHAEGQMGMLHPLHLFLYKFVPFAQAFSLELLIIYLALSVGSYVLFYHWIRDRIAAAFGAFVFTFGTDLIAIVHVNRVAIIAHIPWMLFALDRCVRDKNGHANYWCAVLALLNGSAILLGYPYFFLLSLMLQLWYLIYLAAERISISGFIRAACGVAIGFLIGAAQLIPTADFLRNSNRAKSDFAYNSIDSLNPAQVLQWANPYFFTGRRLGLPYLHEMGIYAGIGPLLLFMWLCTRKHSSSERRLFLFLFGLALIGFFLALGKYNGVFVLYSRLPGFKEFRAPCRYMLFTMFALAAGSALAVKQLRRIPTPAPTRLFNWLAAGLGTLSVATIALKYILPPVLTHFFPHHPPFVNPMGQVIGGASIVCIGIVLFWQALRYRGIWLTAFYVFAIFDLTFYSGTYLGGLPVGNLDYYKDQSPPVSAPAKVVMFPLENEITLGGYQLVNGYAGLQPLVVHPLTDANYLAALGVAAVRDESLQWRIATLPPANEVRFEEPLYSSQPIETMNHVDLTKVAVVTQEVPVDTPAAGSVRIIEQHPGFVRIAAESSGRMLCVLIQRFDPGWTASIGNQKLQLLPVDVNLTGFVVPGGRQDVTLEFRPANLRLGENLSIAGLLLIGVALPTNWILGRKKAGK